MYVISDMGIYSLEKFSEELQPSVMPDRELKKWKERFGDPFKSSVSPYRFINMSFSYRSPKRSLKEA